MSADYTYAVVEGVMCIVDENLGSTSVTNDAANIIASLILTEALPPGMPVIYRDSDGVWDGILVDDAFAGFIPLGTRHQRDAVMMTKEREPDNVVWLSLRQRAQRGVHRRR